MIQPFQWSLPTVTQTEVDLLRAIRRFLPHPTRRAEVITHLESTLTRHLGHPVTLRRERVTTCTGETWVRDLPDQGVIAVVGCKPFPQKLLCHIDRRLVALAIHQLLRGAGVPSVTERTAGELELHPPTETEQGVLQYLLLQCFAALHAVCGGAARAHFRFERFCLRREEVGQLLPGAEPCGVLTWRVAWGAHTGFVELCIPKPFATQALLESLPVTEPEERAALRRRWQRFDWVRTTLWIEGGMSELTPAELTGLEPGDVVLFDECGVRLSAKGIRGEVVVRLGAHRTLGVRGKVCEDPSLKVELVGPT